MLTRPDLLFPFIVFCVVMFYTPGPNNAMLMTSGLNFSFRKTLPHALGVAFGFAFLGLCVGAGLGVIFELYPVIYVVLKYAGALYLLYLAWMIARSEPGEPDAPKKKRPLTFIEAAAFQWVNPKGWVMAISAITTYSVIAEPPLNLIIITVIFVLMGITSSFAWAGLGTYLRRWLHKPKLVRAFNITMAILLVASLYPVFVE